MATSPQCATMGTPGGGSLLEQDGPQRCQRLLTVRSNIAVSTWHKLGSLGHGLFKQLLCCRGRAFACLYKDQPHAFSRVGRWTLRWKAEGFQPVTA